MKGDCKHKDIEDGCKIGVLKFFGLLVCDNNWEQECDDYEEQEPQDD